MQLIHLRRALCLAVAASAALPRSAISVPLSPADWYPHTLRRAEPSRLPGPFLCDSLAFFIVHHGGALRAEFAVSRPSVELTNNGGILVPHSVFWQFYDAEEKLVDQQYHKFVADAAGNEVANSADKTRTRFTATPGAVYRVRAKFGWAGSGFGLSGVPPIFCPEEATARNIRG